ncbi:hypothetical protein ACQPXM_41190 (plasmid) [Kribbella sp. CA-253562]|uniref:hypothetical protein n=1 Tax=Kribbella sp. CA-253562 TaxID=3239942 RepID=UPI003D8FC5D5
MTQDPQRPNDWRDLLNPDYDYSDEILDTESGRGRRRNKRRWRKADRQNRAAWIREERRNQEPVSPGAMLGAVVVVIALVFSAAYVVPKWFTKDEPARGSDDGGGVTILRPTEAATGGPIVQPSSSVTSSPTTSAPVLQASQVDGILQTWAKQFYARQPAVETYDALVDRMEPYFTDDVQESLKEAGDPTYDALATDQGASRVRQVTITAPPATGGAPADTPTRVTRLLVAQIQVTGKRPARFELRALVTVVPDRGSWRISSIAGKTG